MRSVRHYFCANRSSRPPRELNYVFYPPYNHWWDAKLAGGQQRAGYYDAQIKNGTAERGATKIHWNGSYTFWKC